MKKEIRGFPGMVSRLLYTTKTQGFISVGVFRCRLRKKKPLREQRAARTVWGDFYFRLNSWGGAGDNVHKITERQMNSVDAT
ncbi:hypothetical protein MKleb_5703 (plasmid) [Klebsiella sp. PL-2018]|nr:hypothetical protein MKleb_5703 [Klebsiella sp. PL-2018]